MGLDQGFRLAMCSAKLIYTYVNTRGPLVSLFSVTFHIMTYTVQGQFPDGSDYSELS